MSESLFFIAVIPNQKISCEISEFKKYCARHFNSKKALNSPPHITLVPPFRFKLSELPKLLQPLRFVNTRFNSFHLSTDGFDHFGTKVVYIEVSTNEELKKMQLYLRNCISLLIPSLAEKNTIFNPHMSVAFRDLNAKGFRDAWEYFKDLPYNRVFDVKSFYLLKHTGKIWKIQKQFVFLR